MANYSVSNSQNTLAIPYGFFIRRGDFPALSGIDKFGYLPTATSSYKTIWDGDNVYTYPSAATTMNVISSAGASDDGITIYIEGLDSGYNIISETVTLGDDSAGGTATTQEFYRIYRAYNTSNTNLTGNVTIQQDAVVYAKIFAEHQQTNMAVYTIPKGKRGYLITGNISVEKNQPVVAKLMTRKIGGVLRTTGIVSTFGVPFQRKWELPPVLPAGTDIEIRAKAGATTSIAAGFEIVLENA
jgi:hypothetical protein